FLDTIEGLVKDGKVDKRKIRFIFVGRMAGDIHEYLNNSPLKDTIELVSYVPHSESINYLMKADAMLLLIDEDKYSSIILSGKVFEYLGAALISKKPVFAIAGDGEAKNLIEETHAGVVIPHGHPEILSSEYLKLYNGFLNNINTFLPDTSAIKQYERRLLTGKLAQVFDEAQK
ncbi:MAG: hypothetical protein ACHQIH_04605, partial [Ignavibacteria bacterium]